MSCRGAVKSGYPLYPRKLPRLSPTGMSAKGRDQTSTEPPVETSRLPNLLLKFEWRPNNINTVIAGYVLPIFERRDTQAAQRGNL
jgi:hypothetical protein